MTENTRETATHMVMLGSKFLTSDGGYTSDPLNAQPFKDYRNALRNAGGDEVVVRVQVTFVIEEL